MYTGHFVAMIIVCQLMICNDFVTTIEAQVKLPIKTGIATILFTVKGNKINFESVRKQ